MISRSTRRTLTALTAASLVVGAVPAAGAATSPAAAGSVVAAAAAPVTVTVTLKKAWRVTKPKQLKIKDGPMDCRVVKLVRKKPKPATKARLSCSVPESFSPTGPLKLTVIVKGVAGAKVSKPVTFTASPGGGGTPGGGAGGGGGTPPPAAPPTTSTGAILRVNTDAAGNGGNAAAGSPTWSPDGTRVAFISTATNLVPGVADGCPHVFVKTLATGAIAAVDRAQDGTLGNGCPSAEQRNNGLGFSPDGTWLLFCSASSNLGPGAPLGGEDVFGKNLVSGVVEWFGPGCMWPTWSPDGTKIAYATDIDLACPGWANNGAYDVVVIDRNSDLQDCADYGRVSTDSAGNQDTWSGPMESTRPVFSPDSSRIAFSSQSPFLVPNDTNVVEDVFVKDLTTWQTTRVSTGAGGAQGGGASERPTWSPDGTRIAFQSRANDFLPTDTNVHEDIFVKTLATGALSMVSTKADGSPVLWQHRHPSWSPDGTRIAFDSYAVDFVPNDVNTRDDLFVKNLATGFVQLVSSTASGVQGDNTSTLFGVSPRAWSSDGTRVVFESNSTNLAPGDGNGFNVDIFAKTVG